MTSLGFQGLSSQSVSGFCGTFGPENPETDWDDKLGLPRLAIVRFGFLWLFSARKPKRTGMTSLGLPGLSSQSVSGFCWQFSATKPRNASLGFPGFPFRICLDMFGYKKPKLTGMTSLGFPGLSSQSVSGFFGPFRAENHEKDWDDKPGLPRLVVPVCFKLFWPFLARKRRN